MTSTPDTSNLPLRVRKTQIFGWVTLAARLILGITLLVAGLLKVGSLDAVRHSVASYELVPYELQKIVAYPLPYVEMIVGFLLIVGLFTRIAAFCGSGLMLAFIVGIVSVWIRGISIDCGCFSAGGIVAEGQTTYLEDVARDTGLLLCGLWTLWKPRFFFSLDKLFKLTPSDSTDYLKDTK